jgi:hypothetical protein
LMADLQSKVWSLFLSGFSLCVEKPRTAGLYIEYTLYVEGLWSLLRASKHNIEQHWQKIQCVYFPSGIEGKDCFPYCWGASKSRILHTSACEAQTTCILCALGREELKCENSSTNFSLVFWVISLGRPRAKVWNFYCIP